MVKALVLAVALVASGCAGTQRSAGAQAKQDDTMIIGIMVGLLAVAFLGFAVACGEKDC